MHTIRFGTDCEGSGPTKLPCHYQPNLLRIISTLICSLSKNKSHESPSILGSHNKAHFKPSGLANL